MIELLKPEEKAVFSLRKLYQAYGYSRFKMGKFEPYDLYMQNKNFLISDGVITFTDTDGTLMAMKPDVTLSIVKNYRPDTSPIQKVYYNETVYRVAGDAKCFREIMQTGLECMGHVGLYEITEVILLAANSLHSISEHFILDLSHLQIITDLLEPYQLSFQQRDMVLQAIREKNVDSLSDYPTLQKLISLSGPIDIILKQLPTLCSDEKSRNAVAQLQILSDALKKQGLSDHVHIDFSLLNDMNYYNGFIFRGYVEGIPTSILSGGQYDQLMEKMEKPAKGIGFAIYLDQLERMNRRTSDVDVDAVVLYDNQSDILCLTEIARTITDSGESVLLLQELPPTLRYGRLLHYEKGRLKNDG